MNVHHHPSKRKLRGSAIQGQAVFGMANLRPTATGLPFIVFTSQKDDARHAARIKVSPAPKVRKDAMSSYSIDPCKRREGPPLSGPDEALLARWIDLNKSTLLAYWAGEIEYTEDAMARLRSIQPSQGREEP